MAAGKREEMRAAMISEASLSTLFHERASRSTVDYFIVYGHPPGRVIEPRHPIADQLLAEQLAKSGGSR